MNHYNTKMTFFYFVLCIHFFHITFIIHQVYAKEFVLKDLIKYGLMHSPQIINASNRLKINHFRLQNAFANFLPSLDISTDLGYRKNQIMPEDSPIFAGLNLTLSETLYNNGAYLTNYRIAQQENSRSYVEYTRDQNQICLDILKEYHNYSLLTHLLEVQTFQHELLSRQMKSIEQEYKHGARKRIDFLRLKSQLQRSQISLADAQTNIHQSIEQIKQIIGFQEEHLKISSMEVTERNYPSINRDEIENILHNHYEYKMANYSKNINKAQVQLVQRRYWPAITLDASMSYVNPNYLSRTSQTGVSPIDVSAFITLKYNLWDGGIRRRELSISRLTEQISNNQIHANLLTLKTQIEKVFLDIQKQMDNLKLSKELVDLEKENYDSITYEYRNGKLTFLDFINAFNNYKTAQESYYINFFQLQNFLSEYQYHQGKLYENIINY